MKEYNVGDVFTTDEGKTVQCVRSNGLCSGCVFLTKIGSTPRCKARDIDGALRCKARDIDGPECSREDRQHVIFEELEELKHHKEYPVGKVLAFEGKAIKVAVCDNVRSCEGCALLDYSDCFYIPCIPSERTDKNYIIFTKNVTEE